MITNNDLLKDFDYVMELVKNPGRSREDYSDGLNKIRSIFGEVSKGAKKLGLNIEDIIQNAEVFKTLCEGDILPALDHLSKFTDSLDPKYAEAGTKQEYFEAVICWASIAESYLHRNSEKN